MTRVLISPHGALSEVPFAWLLDMQQVVYVPSGTTYLRLSEAPAEPGTGILALGDPEYGREVDVRSQAIYRPGKRLPPLPTAAEEAKAIGDVVLLGADATERGLVQALSKRSRWRAVHLACHGIVSPERPMLSSLALRAEKGSDGFLTCLDVFRMHVPADLVVLSACETARGRVFKAEGIVGLTRAFMFAGAPRVICSLWKVDDKATGALMLKFYDLWRGKEGRPGLSAAAALRRAQEHIRSQPQWVHPYYWAAWVLWGLP